MQTLSDFDATALNGSDTPLADFAGKVVLVVNTASKCGNTPQYEGLENLYKQYGDQFGNQEPGTADEISEFCQLNYGVTFPMFAKIEVNGANAHPLYRWLRAEQPGAAGEDIEWNFAKFLLAKDGTVIKRFTPKTQPDQLTGDIESALAA